MTSLERRITVSRRSRSYFLAAAATVVGSILLSGCNSHAEQRGPAQMPPPTVEVIQARASDADIFVEFPAQTYARNMVDVRGRVDGYIERWLFRPGQEVKAGQPLYVLDLRPYQAAVQQAQGNVRQQQADVTFAQQQVSRLQAEANLATARSNLVKAQQDYQRLKPLVEQDAAAKQDLDTAVAALRAAEANVRSNEANLQQTNLSTKTQIQSAEGKLQAQQGALRTAELNLQYGTIKAPISGLVGDTQVPVGGLVSPNATQPLTTIVPLDPIWVRFKVSEAQYLEFQRQHGGAANGGPALELLLADGTRFPQPGHIQNALNQVDARTGTLELQASFPNPQHNLLPGQFGRVRYVAEKRHDVLMIPQRAVQQNQSIQSVFTVGAGNKVEARAIKTGPRVGEHWIIEQGLKPGDRVVVEGLLSARPGAPVNPIPYQEKPAPQNRRKAG